MAGLPQGDLAIVDLRKLDGYVLDEMHPRGRHKARVFAAALGLRRADADWLRSAILAGILGAEAHEESGDRFGGRWRVDLVLIRRGRNARVRTHWLLPADGSPPRLVTCYVL